MKRRTILAGLGATALGGSALLGSGAFSRVDAQRDVTIQVATDENAYLGMKPLDTPNSNNFVELDDDGHLTIDVGEHSDAADENRDVTEPAQGVNSDSFTFFDGMFDLCNQGKEAACLSYDLPEAPDARAYGDDFIAPDPAYDQQVITFYYISEGGDDPGDAGDRIMIQEGQSVPLPLGECKEIGLRTVTKGVDATLDAPLVEGEAVVTADVDGDCFDDPGTKCPDCSFTPGSPDDEFTNLLSAGPDSSTGFPDVDARIRVDTPQGNGGDLTDENFAICENGCGQTIEDVVFESGGAVDIVVVFDDTGSMSGPISDLKAEVNNFTTNLETEDIDARYALVSFKDNAEVDTDFTDASNFQTAVDGLSASGGFDIPEDNLDALAVGTGNAQAQETDTEDPPTGGELSAFRSGAQRVLIDITDVGAHDETDDRTRFSQSDVESFLNDGNFSYYAVAPDFDGTSLGDVNKRDIADNVDDGTWFAFDSDVDLTPIITDITDDLTAEAYSLSYTTTDPSTDGTTRTVDVEVTDPDEGTLYEQGSYNAPGT
jgi:hypothetical protein